MTMARVAFLVFTTLPAMLPIHAAEDGIAGRWEMQFTGGVGYTTVGDADFDFKVDGSSLTGGVRIGEGWPGTATISEGRIDGDRISFRAVGKNTAMNRIINMKFTGTLRGAELDLTMTIDDRATYFTGKKTSGK